MEKLRWVHRAAAQLIGRFKKFDHISQYMWDVLQLASIPTVHFIQDCILGVVVLFLCLGALLSA